MNDNEIRYIARMIVGYKDGHLPFDATNLDADEFEKMKTKYQDEGRFGRGQEEAIVDFILRTQKNGIPRGRYIYSKDVVERMAKNNEMKIIDRS